MKRSLETTPWEKCVAWVESCGGEVSCVAVSSDGVRGVVVNAEEGLAKDQVVLKIPLACCVLHEDVERHAVGRAAREIADHLAARETGGQLSASVDDVALAFFLAADASDESSPRAPYYATLPNADDLPDVPRTWSDAELDALLGGSPLRKRIDKGALRRDYDAVARCDVDRAWPTFDAYAWAATIVATRSFSLAEGVDALAPLADMLNHSRDRETRYGVDGDCAVWTATRPLAAGAEVHDTYGAKGNAQLLRQFGFAMVANFEPDGSSNDARPLALPVARDGRAAEPVDLRIGAKADVLRPFAACLDAMRAASSAAPPPDDDAFSEGDDDFLDKEDDDGDDDFPDDDDDDDDDDEEERALWARRLPLEVDALSSLAALVAAELRGYALGDPVAALRGAPPPPPPGADAARWPARAAASAALVLNETATLRLYARVAERCREVLRAPAEHAAAVVAKLRADAAAAATAVPGDDVAAVERASSHASAAPAALGYLQLIACPAVGRD